MAKHRFLLLGRNGFFGFRPLRVYTYLRTIEPFESVFSPGIERRPRPGQVEGGKGRTPMAVPFQLPCPLAH
jgi:hypothetical protein